MHSLLIYHVGVPITLPFFLLVGISLSLHPDFMLRDFNSMFFMIVIDHMLCADKIYVTGLL
jgi:hypothetical protein